MKKIITLLVFVFCLLYMESCSQTKASIDAYFNSGNSSSTAKENSSEDGCPKKNYDECENASKRLWDMCRELPDYYRAGYYRAEIFEIEKMEQDFSACSNFYEKCECWADEGYGNGSGFKFLKEEFLKNGPSMKGKIAQLREKETQKREQEREQEESRKRAQAIRDSCANEINALIKEGTEASLISDKCDELWKTFGYYIQECKPIQESIRRQQDITEITALLKANKLEKCLDKCKETRFASDEKITDLCEKQLVDKVRKIPLKKIKSLSLASVYFSLSPSQEDLAVFPMGIPKKNEYVPIHGKVIQNTGKMALLSSSGSDIIVKHSGQCSFVEGWYFGDAYGKYLGQETYTTVLGARRTLPAVQLLWCFSN